jgi:hypothetical protein
MDMVADKSRSVLLVGSLPLDSSASVFETVGIGSASWLNAFLTEKRAYAKTGSNGKRTS